MATGVLYPELTQARVQRSHSINKPASRLRVRLRKENWEQLSSIWEQSFPPLYAAGSSVAALSEQIAAEVLRDPALHTPEAAVQQRLVSNEDNGRFEVARGRRISRQRTIYGGMKYGHFLKQLALQNQPAG